MRKLIKLSVLYISLIVWHGNIQAQTKSNAQLKVNKTAVQPRQKTVNTLTNQTLAKTKAVAEQKALEKKYNVPVRQYPEIQWDKIAPTAYKKGIIRVKFSPEILELVDEGHTKKENKYVTLSESKIDNLNKKFTAKQYKPNLQNLYAHYPDEKKFQERHKAWGFHQWYEISIDTSISVKEAVEAYAALDNVEMAEPVYEIHLIEPVNNPENTTTTLSGFEEGWIPNDTYYNKQWGYDIIDAPKAWELIKGNPEVIVAVFDEGVQYNHLDLEGNMWSGIGPEGTSTAATDHATHVAGTVAAVNNNSTGVAGSAGGDGSKNSGVKIMSLDVINSKSLSIEAAYIYAADHGAAISQNSWGYNESGVFEKGAKDGIDYFIKNGGGDVLDGGIVIFAAGNNASAENWYPGYYSEVIAVAATDEEDKLASFSNYGSWVDISAPGVSIYSTMSNNSYGNLSGTSMACPHVSGVAALVLSYAPNKFTNDQLKTILLETTDNIEDKNTAFSGKMGTGRLNAYKAIEYISSSLTNKPEAGFTASTKNIVIGKNIEFSDTSTNLTHAWKWSFENGFPETSNVRNPIVTWVDPGTYDVQLIATNTVGSDTITLTDYITVTGQEPPSVNPVQIGTTSSGTSGYPLGMSVRYGTSASIYLASEIGGSGDIDSLAWFTTIAQDQRPIKVYIKETTSTEFSADTWENTINGATEVFSGSVSNKANEWARIKLDTPFAYMGTNNLMIMVRVSINMTNSSSGCTYQTTTGNDRHMQWVGTLLGISEENGEPNEKRPWLQMKFNTSKEKVSTNFYGYYNLMEQNFGKKNEFPPKNWTITDNDKDGNNWVLIDRRDEPESFDGDLGYAASYSIKNGSNLTPDNWLITDAIVLPENQTCRLTWRVGAYSSKYAEEEYSVLVSATNKQTSSFNTIYHETLPSATSDWLTRSAELSAYAGDTIFIAFRHYGSSGKQALLLDGIAVSQQSYDSVSAYVGEPVSVYDNTANNPIIWSWNTPDANPEAQSSQNISATYYKEGSYDVTLKTGNKKGSDSRTISGFVKVVGKKPISRFSSQGIFTTYKNFGSFIPQPGVVDFIDETTHYPTNWKWNFNGANETASTLQNPKNINYKTKGTYNVSLITTNNTGADTLVEEGYVTVGGTEAITNLLPTDYNVLYTYKSHEASGVTGHNIDNSTKFAELYSSNYDGEVSAINAFVHTAIGNNKYVTFYVWDESSGSPGKILGSKKVYITDLTAKNWNTIKFDRPVTVSGKFFVGYQIYYDIKHNYEEHDFLTYLAEDRGQGKSTAYVYENGVWYTYEDYYGLYTSLALNPEFTFLCNAPKPDTIYGDRYVEAGKEYTYYVNKVVDVNYEWDIPSTWTEKSTTDSSITVTTGNTGGTIRVTPLNNCGEGKAQTLVVAVGDEQIYTITASSGDYGSIDPSGTIYILEDSDQLFYLLPSEDNEVKTIWIDGTSYSTSEKNYTFNNVTANHTISVEYTKPSSTATTAIASSAMKLYPNPVKEEVNISGISNGKICIYNSLGAKVYAQEYSGGANGLITINTSDFKSGLYFVKFQNNEISKTLKFIKN